MNHVRQGGTYFPAHKYGICPECLSATWLRRDGRLIRHYPATSLTRDACDGSHAAPLQDPVWAKNVRGVRKEDSEPVPAKRRFRTSFTGATR